MFKVYQDYDIIILLITMILIRIPVIRLLRTGIFKQ